MALGIEGIMVSPGYSYHHAPRQERVPRRSASKRLFREIFKRGQAERRAPAAAGPSTTPACSSTSCGTRRTSDTVEHATYNIFGWQRPVICSPMKVMRPLSRL